MGNSLRDVKMRMTATQKTSQITKAMNMVSASKLRKAEKTYMDYRSFMNQLNDVVLNIMDSADALNHPMLAPRKIKKIGYIIITSDRGLAGPYNSNVYKRITQEIEHNKPKDVDYVVGAIGGRGYNYCRKKGYKLYNTEPTLVRDDVAFIDISDFAYRFLKMYQEGEIDRLVVCFNHYVNTISQEIILKDILPIARPAGASKNNKVNYEYDQGMENSLNLVLPMYVTNTLFGLILDSKASEHAARMTAMKSATDNATGVIEELRLLYNRSRQADITKELTDIIGGASAVR